MSSPFSDSDDTVILEDEETPLNEWQFRQESEVSFRHFLSIDEQPKLEPDAQIFKNDLIDQSALPTRNQLNYTSGLSFLQSYPSFSTFLKSNSNVSFILANNGMVNKNTSNNTPPSVVSSSENEVGDVYSSNDTLLKDEYSPDLTIMDHKHNNNRLETVKFSRILPNPVHQKKCDSECSPTSTSNFTSTNQTSHPVQKNSIRSKNREAARKCRAKKKNYFQQLEINYKTLQEKYQACVQENDDLKRLILQQLKFSLPLKDMDKNPILPTTIQSTSSVDSNHNMITNSTFLPQNFCVLQLSPQHNTVPSNNNIIYPMPTTTTETTDI